MSLIIRILVNAVALWVAVAVVNFFGDGDEFVVGGDSVLGTIGVYLLVGVLFGVVNAIIKPIVKTVGCVFYVLTLGLIALVVNALLLLLTGWLADVLGIPFTIDGFWPALWGAIIIAVVSWLLSLFVGGDDDE